MLISVALISVVSLSAQPEPDLDALLARIAERIELYYQRAQNLICVEKVTAQPVGNDMIPAGLGRVLEYELRVESDGPADGAVSSDARVVRDLRKVNGRVPKSKDKAGCYDPNPLSPEPLAFLLAAHRSEYAFFWAGFGRGKDRNALLIDFRSLETGRPALTEDSEGRPDCFSISLPGATRGRVWVDASTADVIRVEEHLAHPVDFSVPFDQQRRHGLPPSLSIDRYDWAIRYKPVAFNDPVETLLLPESIETLAMLRGAQSHRKRQVFSNYQRFMTNARIVKE
jgi:hypothetical protein